VLVSISNKPERPSWLRAPAPVGENYRELKQLVGDLKLHTVCDSAACPNIGECWNRRTATFMILGNVCTRRCGFCAVQKGAPLEVDMDEPSPKPAQPWAFATPSSPASTVTTVRMAAPNSFASPSRPSANASTAARWKCLSLIFKARTQPWTLS
jgi:hypothetical protein